MRRQILRYVSDLSFLLMCIGVSLYVCISCMWVTENAGRLCTETLQLELQVVVSNLMWRYWVPKSGPQEKL